MGSTMKAMNHAYDVEETRPFWKRMALSVGLTVLTGSFFITAFVLAVAGQALGNALAVEVGLGRVSCGDACRTIRHRTGVADGRDGVPLLGDTQRESCRSSGLPQARSYSC
jgi:hypothetical protein